MSATFLLLLLLRQAPPPPTFGARSANIFSAVLDARFAPGKKRRKRRRIKSSTLWVGRVERGGKGREEGGCAHSTVSQEADSPKMPGKSA